MPSTAPDHDARAGAISAARRPALCVALALVGLAGCDTAPRAWRIGRMDCRIHPIERTSAEDPFALHRYAVSPLVAPVLRATHDVRAEWRPGHGLVLEPAGADPAVIVPAPLPLRRSEESVLVLDVTTPGPMTIEVRWTDARCRVPAAPCRHERPVSAAGRQEIRFDLGPDLQDAVESIAIGLRDPTGPVTLHAVWVGAEARRQAGSRAVAVSVLSPSSAPTLIALPDVATHFVDGVGLRVGANAAAAGRRAFAVPVAREATDVRYLVAEIAEGRARGLRLYYTSPACPHFNETCALEATQVTPGTFVADMGASPRWTGTIGALFVDVDSRAEVTVRALRFVPRAEHAALVAGRTLPIVLLAPDVAPALARAPDADASFVAGEGLRTRIRGPQPHVVLRFEHAASHAGVLVLDLVSPERELRVYFTSPRCPFFDEACGATFVRVARDRFAVDLAKHPAWTGLIEHLRLDLPPRAGGELTVGGLRFEPPERAIDVAPFETGAQTRGVDGRARLPGGRIGWEIASGHELDCRFGTGEALRRLPRILEIRVPPDPSAIEFGALRAEWELPDGSRRRAARVVDAFAEPRAVEWTTIALDPPDDPPVGLRVTVSCHKNCTSLGRPALRMHVAQPVYRVLPRTPESEPEPRHLLLVSLDTLRADHLSIYGYGARTDPFLARWAEQATVYEAAYAVDTWTVPTHAALFSGQFPTHWGEGLYHRLPSAETTLAEVLAARGWATIGVADGLVVTAAQGLDQGFDRFDSRFEPLDAKVERFTQLVAEADAAEVPVFAFLHTYEVHNPFQLPEGPLLADILERVAGSVLPVWSDPVDRLVGDPAFQANQEAVLKYLTALYDGSIRVADAALATLLNDPRLARFLARAVVVITADHGEEFLEHGGLGHTRRWPYPELTHVPLLMRIPGQVAGRREPAPVSQANVARLALAAMGNPASLPPGPCTDLGVPLAVVTDEGPPDYPRQRFLTIAAFGRDGMYLRTTDRRSNAVAREEGVADDAVRAGVACLDAELARTARERAGPSPVEVSPDARERLRALGYFAD